MNMINSDDKISTLLVKLNRLTSLRKIEWTVQDAPRPLSRGTDDYIPFFMTARYRGQLFGLFQQRFQSYDGDREKFYWNERLVLAILDSEGRALWEATQPYSAVLDLFETARRKVANVDEIIDDLLADDGDT